MRHDVVQRPAATLDLNVVLTMGEGENTYRYPGGNQIDLVQNKHKMLVRCFLTDVFLNVAAARTQRITRIKNVQNHVAAVNDLVQLAPDAARLALGIHGFRAATLHR